MMDDLDQLLDDLYSTALAAFVQRRNDIVKKLKSEGLKEEAADFKALKKPSTSAWVVNQLHYRHGAQLEELAFASEALRKAHGDPGGNLQEAIHGRRARMEELMVAAKDLLEEGGFSPTRDQLRKISRTLEAATTAGTGHRPGRLAEDLEPAGFGALTGIAIAPPTRSTRTGALATSGSPPAKSTRSPSKKSAPSKSKRPASDSSRSTKSRDSSKKGPSTKSKAGKSRSEAAADEKAARRWAANARLKVEQTKLERAERQVTLAETAHLAAGRYIDRADAKIQELKERLDQAKEIMTGAKADARAKAKHLDEAREALQRASERVREAQEAVDLAGG